MRLSFVLLKAALDVDAAAIVAAHARIAEAAPRPRVASCDGKIAELSSADDLTTHVALMPAPNGSRRVARIDLP